MEVGSARWQHEFGPKAFRMVKRPTYNLSVAVLIVSSSASAIVSKTRLPSLHQLQISMNQRRLFGFVSVLVAFMISVTTYWWPAQKLSLYSSAHFNAVSGIKQCRVPRISPWHQSLKSLIQHPREVICQQVQPNLTFLDKHGILHLNDSAVEEFELQEQTRRSMDEAPKIKCQYSYFDRGRVDREIIFDQQLPLTVPVRLEKNFIRVLCNLTSEEDSNLTSQLVYANLHTHPVSTKIANLSAAPEDDALNIFLFFLDSASGSMVRRHLNSTYAYLTDAMDAFVFDSMLKVGENTLPNLAALLTGLRPRNEQPNMLSELKPASATGGFYDHWPFIWRRYAQAGYVTTYVEDYSRLGTFHYSGDGFHVKPVNNWYFPFYEAMRLLELPTKSSKFCFGNRPLFQVMDDILARHLVSEDWMSTKHFLYVGFSELSHDYSCDLERMDDSLRNFLQWCHESGRLNRTLLVLAGDHGPRFTSIRSTAAGFIEERAPFFSLWIPLWFRESYREIDAALKLNQHRLTSLFDLHQTLIDVLQRRFSGSGQSDGSAGSSGSRGRSLLRPLPLNRSCYEAGIPDRYCLCGGVMMEPITHPLVSPSVRLVLAAIRNETRKYRTRCMKMKLDKVLYFIRVGPQGGYLDVGTAKVYFVAFRTLPLGAVYEGAVIYENDGSILKFYPGTLERINTFGGNSLCVQTIQLKKFCACKDHVIRARKN